MNTQEIQTAANKLLTPLNKWAYQCHAASLEIVRSGILGISRVARGWCNGVGAQHSWVVLGNDCYDSKATIVDPTLWSYKENPDNDSLAKPFVLISPNMTLHFPHGSKSTIWEYGRPETCHPSNSVTLTTRKPFSPMAQSFLAMLGPLDCKGWKVLAHSPVAGWPAAEIIDAIEETFPGLVPIDIVGMLTNRNPNKLYLFIPPCSDNRTVHPTSNKSHQPASD